MQLKERHSNYVQELNSHSWISTHTDEPSTGSGSIAFEGRQKSIVYNRESLESMTSLVGRGTGGAHSMTVHFITPHHYEFNSVSSNTSDPLSVNDKLNTIRSVFGLSISQLAQVMRVERVTIYDWLRKNAMDSLRGTSRARLSELCAIATTWASFTPLSGKFLQEPLPNGRCLIEFLISDSLNTTEILKAYADLAFRKKPAERDREHMEEQAHNARKIGFALKGAFAQLKPYSGKGKAS